MSYYDVREQFSLHDPMKTADTIAIRSINLMCEVLKDVSYNQLYGEALFDNQSNRALDKIIINVASLPTVLRKGATDETEVAFERLTVALEEIRLLIIRNEAYNTKLGSLFYRRAELHDEPHRTVLMGIVRILDDVHDRTDDVMWHFCTPFISMQMKYTNYTTKDAVDKFLAALGGRNIRDFYDDYQRKPEDREAAKLAIDAGILKDRGRPGRPNHPLIGANARVQTAGPGNMRKCKPSGDGCMDSQLEDDWCNPVTVGTETHCAMGSDY